MSNNMSQRYINEESRATVRVLSQQQGTGWSMHISKVYKLQFFDVFPDQRGLFPVIDALE